MTAPVARRLLSLAHLSCLAVPPPQLVRLAARAGFDRVGALRLTPTRDGRGHPMLGRSPMRTQTLTALQDTALAVLDVEVFRVGAQSRAVDAEPLLEAGAELGAQFLLTTVEDPDPERRTQTCAELARLAADHGLRVMLEPMVFSAVRTPAAAARLLEDVGDDSCGVLVDALHLERAGCSPADVAALAPSRLPYAQVCDAASRGAAGELQDAVREAVALRLPPGQGALPLVELLRALPPGVPLSLEVPHPEGEADPEAWCRRLAAAAGGLLTAVDRPGAVPDRSTASRDQALS